MTDVERLILMNQYAILEFLSLAHPEVAKREKFTYHEPKTYAWYQTVLQRGDSILVDELLEQVYPPRLNRDEQIEVLDILNMYRHLQESLADLDETDGLDESHVAFPGWDGNSEKGEMFFARAYCYRSEGRRTFDRDVEPDNFAMVKPNPAHNGHFPFAIEMYRRMLEVYAPLRKQVIDSGFRPLTAAEIKAVLAARVHPDNR